MARDLQNDKLMAKLSAGDMVAQEAKYHNSCLTTLSNEARSTISKAAKVHEDENLTHGIAELVLYVEERQLKVRVFKMTKLSEMDTFRLKLGIIQPGILHSVSLKNRIVASIPSLAYQQGWDTLLAFDSIGTALQQDCEESTDAS